VGGLPVVAVVGRPNVGKSTLVNRLLGRREAIVQERPGVTRDRKVVEVEWGGRRFSVVDTGGWSARGAGIDEKVSRQAERAWREADVVLLVVDAGVGVTAEDREVAAKVRTGPAPVLVVANKVDSEAREPDAWELVQLGLGDPLPVSALHGRRAGDLLDEVVRRLPEATEAEPPQDGPKVPAVAIVGRPNVGKSTLFNRLLGDERSVVHDLPGTTRDTIDTEIETELGRVRFLDTAGMRRKSKIDEGTEYYSVVRALQAVDVADVALLVLDAGDGVTAQDQRLAERIDAAGSPIVIILNKWDTLDAEGRAAARASVGDRLAFLPEAPVIPVSARSGKAVHKLLPALGAALDTYMQRVPTRELNRLLQQAQAETPSPGGRVLYGTQGASEPPTFTLFATRTLPPTYLRYLERRIREQFGFGNAPLKLRVRRRSD
jgi:GTPase